jgi:hypothetical protein
VFGKLLAGLVIADPARVADTSALLESLSRAVALPRWNTALTSFITSGYFDTFGLLLAAPQSAVAMIALQLEDDRRTAPAFAILAEYLEAAEAQLPYRPGTGRGTVSYAVDSMPSANSRPSMLRGLRVAGQTALIENLSDESRQRFDVLLGRPPSQGCTGKELRSAVARQFLIPADLLANTWDKKEFFWPAGMGLARVDTASEGGISQLEDLEE